MCTANKHLLLAALAAWTCLSAQAQAGPKAAPGQTEAAAKAVAQAQQVEEIRETCLQNRRRICGKIVQVLPDGLVIDSGYTNLMRAPLNRSWLMPGSVSAQRAAHVVEENHPGCFCFGLVFLTDLPKARDAQPKPFDYVNLEAFPEGQFTYTSAAKVQHTVRKFSAKLSAAVQWALQESAKPARP